MMDFLKDFIFPRVCLGCGRWENTYLCADCVNFLKPLNKPICAHCFKPAIGGQTHPSCRQKCGLDGLTATFPYKGIVKKIIQQLKYQYQTDLIEIILEMILSFVGEDKGFVRFTHREKAVLVPVPLHWLRKNWRGFNQAEILGERLALKLGIRFLPNLLVRRRYTRSQSKLKKEDRMLNVKGAFAINKTINKKSLGILISQFPNVLLFDDVWTTGSTLRECAQVLKRNGVEKVWALTLAR